MLGFVGVIAILRPGTDAFSWFTILPLLAAAFYAVAMVLTRSKCQDEAPLALSLALNVSFLVTGLTATVLLDIIGLGNDTKAAFPFLLGDWAPMGVWEWGLMAFPGALLAAYSARGHVYWPPQGCRHRNSYSDRAIPAGFKARLSSSEL